VLEPAGPAGELLGDVRRSLHLSGRFCVAPGTGDNMAAALGVGLVPGDVVVSLGTSGTVFTVTESPVADGSGEIAGFADATGRYLPLVCTLNATRVPDTFARLLGVDRAVFGALALSSPPGSNGVVLRPYLEGERTPDRPDATGVLSGLRTTTTQADVARAAIEGVLCGLLDGLDALRRAGVAVDGRLVLAGGGARSAAFRQVLADLSGRPVEVLGEEELVARGACVQAAAVLHGRDVLEVAEAWRPLPTVVTDPVATPEQASTARAAYAVSVS
jgi:xylulokinase